MNCCPILTVKVNSIAEVVLARQRAQSIAQLAGFDTLKQTIFATALSEIARNAVQYAGFAKVKFAIEWRRQEGYLAATVVDQGPGIPKIREGGGHWLPSMIFEGQGIQSARKLLKFFSIECPPEGGTTVRLGLKCPANAVLHPVEIGGWSERLARKNPRNLLDEVQAQNQELMAALQELQHKEAELERQIAADVLLKAALNENQLLLEGRVRERTESLSLSILELRAFSYSVSHDLRAPLRAINGFTHMLLEDHLSSAGDEARITADRILTATARMDELIQDMAIYTQANQGPVALLELDPRKLIESVVKDEEVRPEHTRIEIHGEFPRILADASLLFGVLLNLLENAFKFRDPNKESVVIFRGQNKGTSWRLWVEDQGIGIAPEHHEQIFRVFERLHGPEVPGTGMGLALSRRWMTEMGGTTGVESSLGSGARFWIELPLKCPE